MATTGLCQTETETPAANVSIAPVTRNDVRLLLNFEGSQSLITRLVSSFISHTSYDLITPQERPYVINDVTQNTWLKLLSSRLEVTSPKGLVASAARSEYIDEIRRRDRRRASPLPLDQDGELLQGKALLPTHDGMRNPSVEYEFKEWLTEVVGVVVQLPKRQVYALVCAMKDEVGDHCLLAELFRAHKINIERIHWPRDQKELQKLRSLLSVARRTLRKKFNRPVCNQVPK